MTVGLIMRRIKGTYLGHRRLALEATPHPVIDTFGLSPCLFYAMVAVRLMAPGYMIRILSQKIHAIFGTDLNFVVRFLTILMAIEGLE